MKLVTLFALIVISLNLMGQFPEENRHNRRFWGSDFYLQIGSYTNIEIAPYIGYWVKPRINIGIRSSYRYFANNTTAPKYYSHIYSGSLFSEYIIIKDISEQLPFLTPSSIFVHSEIEMINLETQYYYKIGNDISQPRFYYPAIWFGVGDMVEINSKIEGFILVLWDINDQINSPYSNPNFRIGMHFKF